VHAILDDSDTHLVAELATRVREAMPDRHVHLVLENEANEARWLPRAGDGRPTLHTAQWADDIHNSWHALLTGEREGYYEDFADKPVERLARALAEGFAYQGDPSSHKGGALRGEPSGHLPPSAFVSFLQNHDQTGNRAFGERLSELVAPEPLRLARAALILCPQVPLLFMGEDWAASTPFLFFVDFAEDEALSAAVRNGRRNEFSRFTAFADPRVARRIPDPTCKATFLKSKLDWSEAQRPPHSEVRAEMRDLLHLRRAEIVPLTETPFLGSTYEALESSGLDVTWRFERGTLRFIANFFETERRAWLEARAGVLWASPSVERTGAEARLPPWTALFVKGRPA
jgi:maltooligosyltrehalose trehalohydrolase